MCLDAKSTTRCSRNHSHFRCLKMLTADLASIFFGPGMSKAKLPSQSWTLNLLVTDNEGGALYISDCDSIPLYNSDT